MTDIATLRELRANISSGDIVTRDIATSVAIGLLLDDLITRREAADGIAYGTSGGAIDTSGMTGDGGKVSWPTA